MTEAILLVDAENSFNNLNREAAIHNINRMCSSLHRYLANTYQLSAKVIINDKHTTDYISSDEGTMQGDVIAMGMYAIGVKPLIDTLAEKVQQMTVQVQDQ